MAESKAARAAKAVAQPEPNRERPKGAVRFGLCEGTREEIERTGEAVDPFTGRTLTRDDL